MAINWLDNANFNNRAVREDYVERIANDMINGRWDGRNGEPIKFDTTGRLIEGQHRMWACVKSDTPFETLMITGVSPESYNTSGIGRPKSFADFLGPVHGEKNVFNLASAVRLVYHWSTGTLDKQRDGKTLPTIKQLETVYRDHPNLKDSVSAIANRSDVRKIITPSYAMLIHYAATLENNSARVESFFDRLGSGLGLYEDDPVYHLRRFLLSQRSLKPGQRRSRQEYVLALAIKAWNACKNEQKMKALSFRVGEPFPQL